MIQSFVRPCLTSSSSRFHFVCRPRSGFPCRPVPVLLASSSSDFACQFRIRFCIPAGSGLHTNRFPNCVPARFWIAYQPVSGFAYQTRFPDLLTGQFPVLGNLATIIHQDKVAKVLLAQMKNEGFLCAYIARALICLSMWDKS